MKRIFFILSLICLIYTSCDKVNTKPPTQSNDPNTYHDSVGFATATVDGNDVEYKKIGVKENSFVNERVDLDIAIYQNGIHVHGMGIDCIDLGQKKPQKVLSTMKWYIVDSIGKQRLGDTCTAFYILSNQDAVEEYYYTLDTVGNYIQIHDYDPSTGAFTADFKVTFFRSDKGKPRTTQWPDTLRITDGHVEVHGYKN